MKIRLPTVEVILKSTLRRKNKMDKYVIAPPEGSTNNSVGAEDRPWKEGHFEKLVADDVTMVFDTVADMKADTSLNAGMTVKTTGYFSPNDGGAAYYIIKNTTTKYSEPLANGLYAELLFTDTVLTAQLGDRLDDFLDINSSYITLIVNSNAVINKTHKLLSVTIDGNYDVNKILSINKTISVVGCIIKNIYVTSTNTTDFIINLGFDNHTNANNHIDRVYFLGVNYAIKSDVENDTTTIKNCSMFSGQKFIEIITGSTYSPSEAMEISGNHIAFLNDIAIKISRFASLNFHNNIINTNKDKVAVHLNEGWGLNYICNHHEHRGDTQNDYMVRLNNMTEAYIHSNVLENANGLAMIYCTAVASSVLGRNEVYGGNIEYKTDGNCNTIDCLSNNSTLSDSAQNVFINNYKIWNVKNINDSGTYNLTSADLTNYDGFIIGDNCTGVYLSYANAVKYKEYHVWCNSATKTFNFSTDRGVSRTGIQNIGFKVHGINIYVV